MRSSLISLKICFLILPKLFQIIKPFFFRSFLLHLLTLLLQMLQHLQDFKTLRKKNLKIKQFLKNLILEKNMEIFHQNL